MPNTPKTPMDMYHAVIANLPTKTGRTLEEWVAIVREQGMTRPMVIVNWLKTEHQIGHSTAGIIANEALKPADFVELPPAELLARQYAGPKASLRPIFEAIAEAVAALGGDTRQEVRQQYVAFVRIRQFALAQPSTRTRMDLGLVLPGVAPAERLVAAGSFGSGRITHRVALATPADVDAAVLSWLRTAYQDNG